MHLRSIFRSRKDPPPPPPDPSAFAVDPGTAPIDLMLTGAGIARFGASLRRYLGPDTPRLDTPVRLHTAVAQTIERLGGRGRPFVMRHPPGLSSVEAWTIRVDGADPASRAALNRAAQGADIEVAAR